MTIHVGGRGFGHTCRTPLHAIGLGGGAVVGITAPSLTLTSAAGAAPEWDTTLDSTVFAGYYLHIEASADGIKSGDGTYTTPTQAIDHFITDPDVASGTITSSELVADGWADPGGTWYIHCWVFREDGTKSAISNELSGTVTGSAAVLSTTTGVSKSQYVNTSGTPPLSAAGNANVGAYCGVRSSIGKTGKGHFEVTLTGGSSGDSNGSLWFGVTDASTINMNASPPIPGGAAGAPGITVRVVRVGNNGFVPFFNGAPQTGVTSVNLAAVGDIFAVEFDTATGVVNVYRRPVSTGTWGLLQSYTMSTQVPSAPYFGHIGLAYADASCTVNFGATAFSMTPTTGYSGW